VLLLIYGTRHVDAQCSESRILERPLPSSHLHVRRDANRVVATVESDKVALEEDVAVDGQSSGRGLETTKAVYEMRC
jgi:hypothetical protein